MPSRYPVVTFLALRTLLLVAVAGVLWGVGVRGPFALVLALLVSGGVSLVALRHQRDAVSGALDVRVRRMQSRMSEAASSEDE